MDGTVGYSVRTIREQSYSWTPSSMLVLASDGLSTRWNLAEQAGLLTRHPSLVAAVLHRDYARGLDDASVAVVKGMTP
jgi:serine/threonine protein phosphatase PrpC